MMLIKGPYPAHADVDDSHPELQQCDGVARAVETGPVERIGRAKHHAESPPSRLRVANTLGDRHAEIEQIV